MGRLPVGNNPLPCSNLNKGEKDGRAAVRSTMVETSTISRTIWPCCIVCAGGLAFRLVQGAFPAEFMAAVLANWGGNYSQRVYLSEARRLGLTVRPPYVNYSGSSFQVRAGTLYMGLEQVKELTKRTFKT